MPVGRTGVGRGREIIGRCAAAPARLAYGESCLPVYDPFAHMRGPWRGGNPRRTPISNSTYDKLALYPNFRVRFAVTLPLSSSRCQGADRISPSTTAHLSLYYGA